MQELKKDELREVLEKILPILEKVLPNELKPKNNAEKHQLIDDVMNFFDLNNVEIEKHDLKNPTMQKSLALALIMQRLVNKYPEQNFNLKFLFEKNANPNLNELKPKLKNEFKKLFLMLNELNPKNKINEKELDKFAEKLANKLSENFMKMDQDMLAKNDDMTNSVTELYLRSIYGGDDPRILGEINYPVLGPIVGDLIGHGGIGAPVKSEEDVSLMADLPRYDPNKPDYVGT